MRQQPVPKVDQQEQEYLQILNVRRLLRQLPKEIVKKVPAWKLKHSNIYATRIRRKWYVHRSVTYNEASSLIDSSRIDVMSPRADISGFSVVGSARAVGMGILSNYFVANPFAVHAQDLLLNSVLLYPEDVSLDEMLQGDVSALLGAIWSSAGFSNIASFADMVDQARMVVQSSEDPLISFVSRGTGIDPMKVREMDAPELARYVAVAELALGTKLPIGTAPQHAAHSSLRRRITEAALANEAADMGGKRQTPGKKQNRGEFAEHIAAIKYYQDMGTPAGGASHKHRTISMDSENLALGSFGFNEEHANETIRTTEQEHIFKALGEQ